MKLDMEEVTVSGVREFRGAIFGRTLIAIKLCCEGEKP